MKYLSHSDFLTKSFSQRLSHNVFLPKSFSQRLSHTVAHIRPHNVYRTASRYTHNRSVLYEYPKISQIRLSSVPHNTDIFWSIKLKPRRCTFAIYILTLCEVSEP